MVGRRSEGRYCWLRERDSEVQVGLSVISTISFDFV